MNYLVYDIYRQGKAGLSNLIMSLELGVVLAALTNRVLVLRGNKTPTANVVSYGDDVSNLYPSRVTDLLDVGVPWMDSDHIDLARFSLHDVGAKPAWECAFYFPASLDTGSSDFSAFAAGRPHWLTVGDDLSQIPALLFSGGPEFQTLSFYSYFFYLDRAAQQLAYNALIRTQAKPEYAAFADRVAKDLGQFNAVHIRRGDFKKTIGTTTLTRSPHEAISLLEQVFSKQDRLVIVTDEMDDPFFEPMAAAFPNHVFMDRHVLSHFGREFNQLPQHDSIALAFLSQLIAARAVDFVGSMTSTYTALIQRLRGQSGKNELFKFLWNELPEAGEELRPGRHRASDCIQLDKGEMVPVRESHYSWGRYNNRLNPAWMREWPESFLIEDEMLARARRRTPIASLLPSSPPQSTNSPDHSFLISFGKSVIAASSNDEATVKSLRSIFQKMVTETATSASSEVRLDVGPDGVKLQTNGKSKPVSNIPSVHLRSLYRQVVCELIDHHPEYIWLHAGSVANDRGAVVLPGEWARGKSSLTLELVRRGWQFLSDDISPLDPAAGLILPFPCTPQVRIAVGKNLTRGQVGGTAKRAQPLLPAQISAGPRPLVLLVFPRFIGDAKTELLPMSPGQIVGKCIENCLSIVNNIDATVAQFCAMAQSYGGYELVFGDVVAGADLIEHIADMRNRASSMRN